MKRIKKMIGVLLSVACSFTVFTCVFGEKTYSETIGVTASAAEYQGVFDTCEETSPFGAIRLLGQKDRMNEILGKINENEYNWYKEGYPSSIVNFDMRVSVEDWTEATTMRIRFKSNGLASAATNSNDNNMAVGFGGLNPEGNVMLKKITIPYGKAKFVDPNGKTVSPLYYVNNMIPYFNLGRWQNCYVEMPLDGTTFGYCGPDDLTIFPVGGNVETGMQIDMSKVKYVFIRLEPMNYAGMCLDVGNVEIKKDGEWITVFDADKATIVEKAEKTWEKTIESMSANECILDPHYKESIGATTDCYRVSKIAATPCTEHVDENMDSLCDVCLNSLPHEFYDLAKDGICDDCGRAICGEGVCKDENGDGGCDVCFHTDYVEQPAPKPPVNSEDSDSENSDKNQGKGSEKNDGGCGSLIGGAVFGSAAILALSTVYIRRKRK